jgi:hypothetical protein
MVLALGGRCYDCGATERLEFDCIEPRGGGHHGLDTARRMSFYRREAIHGNLALRCQMCNGLKADRTDAKWRDEKARIVAVAATHPHMLSEAILRTSSLWCLYHPSRLPPPQTPRGDTPF